MTKRKRPNPPKPVRCAVYTRKSTEEGLDQEFNTLDAQLEACRAFISSQRSQGWKCLTDRYDDGGFSGSNMERPGLRRLLADIQGGKVDCVVVYKVDRLSRSLLDFVKMMSAFEENGVSFVSVTQQFNTATSMGRLILNVLLSFAQFEREMISERTRDKIAAARRKGHRSGGMPLLGYDVVDRKLVVNESEASRVRWLFQAYLEYGSLKSIVDELRRRDWTTKSWVTRKGTARGGRPFTRTNLHQLLTNFTYLGKIRYKDEIHDGMHEAIVERSVFEQVQQALRENGPRTAGRSRSKADSLLSGLLWCASCGQPMRCTYSCRGPRRYRYYVCAQALREGWSSCPAPSVSAGEMETFVVNRLKSLSRTPPAIALNSKSAGQGGDQGDGCTDALDQISIRWDELGRQERARLLSRLIERVDHDGQHGKVSITFRSKTEPTKKGLPS